MVSSKHTGNLHHAILDTVYQSPPDQWITAHLTTQKKIEGIDMGALQIVGEVILFTTAPKQTRQFNWFMVSPASGPAITPPLQDLDSHRTSTLFQAAKAVLQKGGAVEIKLFPEDVFQGRIKLTVKEFIVN